MTSSFTVVGLLSMSWTHGIVLGCSIYPTMLICDTGSDCCLLASSYPLDNLPLLAKSFADLQWLCLLF